MADTLPRLLYITSRGHSGSTLLELLLGGHSAVTPVGELKQLVRNRGSECRCHKPILTGCPFWGAVQEKLRHTGLALDELDPMHRDPELFVLHNRALLEAVHSVAGTPWIVDSSKSLGRLRRLLDLEVAEVRVLHLTRRPVGVVASNLRRGRDWRSMSRNYTIAMRKTLELLQDHPSISVRYEELATRPESTLVRVMSEMGLRFERGQLDWATNEGHLIAGNAMRFSTDSSIRLDRRWAREIGLARRLGIAWLTLPARLSSPWLYEAHLPYWKGEGWEAWRTYRRKRVERIRRERRHRLLERHPSLRPAYRRLRSWWRRAAGHRPEA